MEENIGQPQRLTQKCREIVVIKKLVIGIDPKVLEKRQTLLIVVIGTKLLNLLILSLLLAICLVHVLKTK